MNDTNVGLGMVPCSRGCDCNDCTHVRQRKRIKELEAGTRALIDAVKEHRQGQERFLTRARPIDKKMYEAVDALERNYG